MKFFKSKAGKAISVVVVCALLLAFITHFTGQNPVSNLIRTVFAPFQTGFSYVADKVGSTIDLIYEMNGYREENERLVAENAQLKKEHRDTEHYRREIEELRSILKLDEQQYFGTSVAASVIGYGFNNYYDKIEINKGTMHGVKQGAAVITSEGLVGLVSEVGINHSIVTTIIAEDNAIGITISRTGDIGVVEGDTELCLNSQCKLTFVDKDVNIMAGDILETSGSGGIYPQGITLGIIRDINMDNLGMLNYAVVDTAVNFREMHEVLVINSVEQQ